MIAKHVPSEKFLPHTRAVYLPGFTATVREELEALVEVAGKEALDLIEFKVSLFHCEFRGSADRSGRPHQQAYSWFMAAQVQQRLSLWYASPYSLYSKMCSWTNITGMGFVADEGGMLPIVKQFKKDIENGIA